MNSLRRATFCPNIVYRRKRRYAYLPRGNFWSGCFPNSRSSLEEAISINNSVEYGLSSSIFTQNINHAYVAQRDLDTGIVYVNAGTTGAEIHLPFGGTKGTGNGHRDSGMQALDVFTEWRSIYVDYSGKLQRAQIDI